MSVESVLALFGGAQLVLVALVTWLGKLWLERTLARERHARERELESLRADQQLSVSSQLERLRSDLGQQQAVLAASMSAASAAGSLGHKERLSAVERMWRAARCHHAATASALIYWDDIYLIGGKQGEALTAKGKAYFADQLSPQKLAHRCDADDEAVGVVRPFLGEELWSLYYGHRMLLGRASVPLGLALQEGKNPESPFDDKDVQALIQRVLTPDEFREFSALRDSRLAWLIARFESKIMAAAANLISGRQAALESYRQSLDILQTAQRLEPAVRQEESRTED
jgi:hypothetical protein